MAVILPLFNVNLPFKPTGRRRNRRSRDCDAMSVRSGMTDKSFYAIELGGGRGSAGEGAGPGRITRQISSSSYVPSPKMLAPEVPGNRLVMQYQKPRDTVPDANTFTFSGERLGLPVGQHYRRQDTLFIPLGLQGNYSVISRIKRDHVHIKAISNKRPKIITIFEITQYQ